MWHDNETRIDYINFDLVAQAVAALVQQARGEPISVGICGSWGTGKSSLVQMVRAQFEKQDEKGGVHSYVVVEFNPWLYQDFDDARSAILQSVGDALLIEASKRDTAVDKVRSVLARVKLFRLLRLGGEAAATLLTGVPVGAIGQAIQGVVESIRGEDGGKAVDAYAKAGKDAGAEAAGVLRPAEGVSLPSEIQAFRHAIEKILEELGLTLVVFVDDLDRCLPSTAIKTLEAMRLLLFLKHSAFVIAADDEVLRAAVSSQLVGAGISDKSATNYFDKLIQVPIRVPRLGTNEVTGYIALLFMEYARRTAMTLEEDKFLQARAAVQTKLRKTWTGTGIDLAFLEGLVGSNDIELRSRMHLAVRLAPLMVRSSGIEANPRLIKRFLNTVFLRKTLAEAQKISVDIPMLAKWHLLERNDSKLADLIGRGITSGTEGLSPLLQTAEEAARAGSRLPDSLGESDFIKEWLLLEPSMADSDLRPILHLSRDTQIYEFGVDALNEAGKALVETLYAAKSSDGALKAQLSAAGEEQAQLAMERAWTRRSSSRTWKKFDELIPLIAVCGVFPGASTRAKALLSEAPLAQVGAALVEPMATHTWGKEVLRQWGAHSDAADTLKRAIKAALVESK